MRAGAAREFGLGVGELLQLQAGLFHIVGIYHAGVAFEDQSAALAMPVVQRILGRPGEATTIAVKLDRGENAAAVGARLERAFRGTVAIRTLIRAVLVAVATGAIGSLYPAWRVTRLRPAEALG